MSRRFAVQAGVVFLILSCASLYKNNKGLLGQLGQVYHSLSTMESTIGNKYLSTQRPEGEEEKVGEDHGLRDGSADSGTLKTLNEDSSVASQSSFCPDCMFNPSTMRGVTCLDRVKYIAKRYKQSFSESKEAAMSAEPDNCKRVGLYSSKHTASQKSLPAADSAAPARTTTESPFFNRTVVISMGICISKRAQSDVHKDMTSHRHKKKPYDVAAILSTRMWQQQIPSLKVIVVASYPSQDDLPLLQNFTKSIERAGGQVWPVSTESFSDPAAACIRAAQIGRSFLHESGLLKDDEIVVTSDVDAFPVNATKRLAPLNDRNKEGDFYRAWVSNYGHALKGSFPMCFLGMTVSDWRMSWQKTNITLSQAVHFGLNETVYTWGVDQLLTTTAFLEGGLCEVPPTHTWYKHNRIHRPRVDDTLTCNKGALDGNHAQCLSRNIPSKQCSWVHFLPSVTQSQLESVYTQIGKMYPYFRSSEVLLRERERESLMEARKVNPSSLWEGWQQILDASPETWRSKSGMQVRFPFSERSVTVVPGVAASNWWKKVGENVWEPFTFRAFNQEIVPGVVYVGFGEWAGVTGLYAMQRARKTIMIDADPIVRDELRENVRRNAGIGENSEVALDFRCISNATGSVSMHVHGGSGSSIVDISWAKNFKTVTVDCLPLPALLREYRIPTDGKEKLFLKIDTEGAEAMILPSLKSWLDGLHQTKLPTIFVSMHGKADDRERAQIAQLFNLYPFFGTSDDKNKDCPEGVRLESNANGDYFSADKICHGCDYLLVASANRSESVCPKAL